MGLWPVERFREGAIRAKRGLREGEEESGGGPLSSPFGINTSSASIKTELEILTPK